MKIIAGTTHLELAKNIARVLGSEFIRAEVRKFSDGELAVTIPSDLADDDIVIVQSICSPVSDNLFELLAIIDIAKSAKAKDITTVIPYFGYSRNDLSVRLIANLLECAGATKIITIDLHSAELKKFFKIPIINLNASDLFLPLMKTSLPLVIVSPDQGGISRAKKVSNALNYELAIINKEREDAEICHMTGLKGNVEGKHCVIIDDIIDSGGTLQKAVEFLIQYGATSVEAFITHGVLSNYTTNRFENSIIKNIYITNTILKDRILSEFNIIPIDELIISGLRDSY